MSIREDELIEDLHKEITDLTEKLAAAESQLQQLLNPRMWTKEMSDEWHRNLPDLQAAFDALKEVQNYEGMK